MGALEQQIQKLNRDDNIALGRRVLNKLGRHGRLELLSYFAAIDRNFAFKKKEKSKKKGTLRLVKAITQSQKDLQDLGIEITEGPKLEIPETSRDSFFRLNQNEIRDYSSKELELLFAKDVPDKTARGKIISLFFEDGGYHSHVSVCLLETIRDIESLLNPESSIGNEELHELKREESIKAAEKSDTVKVLNAGNTPKKVNSKKKEMGIPSSPEDSTPAEVVNLADYHKKRVEGAFPLTYEEKADYLLFQHAKLQEFVKSVFCFFVSQSAQMPENIIWAVEPNKAEFKISKRAREKMKLIESITDCYNIFPYHLYLKEAVRCFIRYHNGI